MPIYDAYVTYRQAYVKYVTVEANTQEEAEMMIRDGRGYDDIDTYNEECEMLDIEFFDGD